MTRRDVSVAVVGIGGVFPEAASPTALWSNVLGGISSAREAPRNRWLLPMEEVFDPTPGKGDKVYSRRACFIESLPPAQLLERLALDRDLVAGLDPLFHLLFHAGLQAFDDAVTSTIDLSRAGIIIGNIALPTEGSSALSRHYLGRTFSEVAGLFGVGALQSVPHHLNRYVTALPAGLLAKGLGLGGGTSTLDAACASSLYAVKLACDELMSGRADMMLTGGVSRPDPLYTQMGFSQLRALSPRGICSPFDARADGLVTGEGSGILVLKRTGDAIRDGDRIYGILRGFGLSNDIGGGLLAPSSEGQLRAMRSAYESAGWSPAGIDHVECHATGTPVGDSVELESLGILWREAGGRKGKTILGSVKSNIGHLLTGAGAAALIKTLLALRSKTLPPTANFERPNPKLAMEHSSFEVLTAAREWESPEGDRPRRAAVSAFGFGGINAHVLVEEWAEGLGARGEGLEARIGSGLRPSSDPSPLTPNPSLPIAIVGMDASFGEWTTLSSFQQRVLGGMPDARTTTPTRWWGTERSRWFENEGFSAGQFKGHYCDGVEVPLERFRIPPKELEEMLPQQLLMLRVAAGAMDDARIGIEEGRNGGVFIGVGLDLNTTNFSFRWSVPGNGTLSSGPSPAGRGEHGAATPDPHQESLRDSAGPALTANRTMGALASIAASRIARELKIGGPSFTISAEESSGMKAVETAVRALQQHEVGFAIAGAVDLAGDFRAVLATHREREFSPSGRPAPLDASADGTVPGEGAAALVLKRLDDAQRDGDRIYAVITGIGRATPVAAGRSQLEAATRQGGVPDSQQEDLAAGETSQADTYVRGARRALENAGISAGSIQMVEAHGSGDAHEDKIEALALRELFDSGRREKIEEQALPYLSSVKGDIGHAGAASALASMVKTALCLHHGVVPPLRNFVGLRNELSSLPFRVPPAAHLWLRNRAEGNRRALVSSMSIDGNSVHAVLESVDAPAGKTIGSAVDRPDESLFCLAADSLEQLSREVESLRALASGRSTTLHDIAAATSMTHGGHFRLGLVSRSREELLDQTDFILRSLRDDGGTSILRQGKDRVFFSPAPAALDGKLALVFPGSGSHYAGMGRELALHWPELMRNQDRREGWLRDQFQPDLFWSSTVVAPATDLRATMFGQVALATLAADFLASISVTPDAVIGYSLGESAAFFAMKIWEGRDEMLSRIKVSSLFTSDLAGRCNAARETWNLGEGESVDWIVGVIDRPASEVRKVVADHPRAYLLIVNTPGECVIGGAREAVSALVSELKASFFPLHGVTTVHCEVALPVEEKYRELHLLPVTPNPSLTVYSGANRSAYEVTMESAAAAIAAQATGLLDFAATIEQAYADGIRIFLELPPGNACSRMISRTLGERKHLARPMLLPGVSEYSSVLRMAAQLHAEGVSLDLAAFRPAVATTVAGRSKGKMLRVETGGAPFEVRHQAVPELLTSKLVETRAALQRVAPVNAVQPADDWTSGGSQAAGHQNVRPLAGAPGNDSIARAHQAFLQFSSTITGAIASTLSAQLSLIEALDGDEEEGPATGTRLRLAEENRTFNPIGSRPSLFDRAACMELAIGSVGKVLGPEFREVDTFPTRVRLPDEPLMLVDRIVSIEGEPRSMTRGRVVTEHDIHEGSWYLDCGRIPTCIAVEAGQADLFLSGYLGIDFETRGLAVYRLLDAVVTFHQSLPGPGSVIHYDISIDHFFRQGKTILFRFSFEATVEGEPLLSMRNGCAGFFTDAELEAGQGIIQTRLDLLPAAGVKPPDWKELVPMSQESYGEDQIDALRRGDLAGCFGSGFDTLPLLHPETLPGGRMKLVDRITSIDPTAGRFGLGVIRSELDIHPAEWFLTCHFSDDQVMPGTLMFECCLHTLRIFLMRMGWVAEHGAVRYEPRPGVSSALKCRGQVIETTRLLACEVSIREIGYGPEPYAIANALMFADGKPVVEISNMSVRLSGQTRESIESLWGTASAASTPALRKKRAIFDYGRILAFATGKPSVAFGKPYEVFDSERIIARLPGPPYQFLDRITEIDAEPWKMIAGGTIEAEYDVPEDAWYFSSNRQEEIPFAVLLEIALQPCGWLAAYVGSALTSPTDLSFRNLGGSARLLRPVTAKSGTLATRVKITRVASTGGMIIQNYDFEMSDRDGVIYSGETNFGFFSKDALSNQVGIREAKPYAPSSEELDRAVSIAIPDRAPFPDVHLRMVDGIDLFIPNGGPHALGFLQGTKKVDAREWFFKAHFHQDPVVPGSLGLESFIQLLKVAAAHRWGEAECRFGTIGLNDTHRWTYRGQIVPASSLATVQATIRAVDDSQHRLTADGLLMVDGRPIYQMNDFVLQLV